MKAEQNWSRRWAGTFVVLTVFGLLVISEAQDEVQKWRKPDGSLYIGDKPPTGSKKIEDGESLAPAGGVENKSKAPPEAARARAGTSSTGSANSPTVLFVLDASGSMWARVQGKPKIETARAVMGGVLKSLAPDVRVGLLTYGHRRKNDCKDIEVVAAVGSDRAAVMKAVNGLNPKGETPLTDSLKLAAAQLKEVEGAASVVVVTDGEESCGGDPCAAAREAAASGVHLRIHVVGFDVKADEAKQLQCIAKEGKGRYFSAASTEQLASALAEVQKEVAQPLPTAKPIEEVPAPSPPPLPTPTPAKKVLFEDHFDGNKLGEIWELRNPDPNRLTVTDGKLLIILPSSSSDELYWTHPPNLALVRKPITGDFIVSVKETIQVGPNSRAGLYYYVDDKNLIFLGVAGPNRSNSTKARLPLFTKLLSGAEGSFGGISAIGFLNDQGWLHADQKTFGSRQLEGYLTAPEDWYLQLERLGIKYIGRMSLDGVNWKELGTHTFFSKEGRLGLGGVGEENTAEFDEFVVKGPGS